MIILPFFLLELRKNQQLHPDIIKTLRKIKIYCKRDMHLFHCVLVGSRQSIILLYISAGTIGFEM